MVHFQMCLRPIGALLCAITQQMIQKLSLIFEDIITRRIYLLSSMFDHFLFLYLLVPVF